MDKIADGVLPSAADLIERIQFNYAEGKIWLDENRMLLLHSGALIPSTSNFSDDALFNHTFLEVKLYSNGACPLG